MRGTSSDVPWVVFRVRARALWRWVAAPTDIEVRVGMNVLCCLKRGEMAWSRLDGNCAHRLCSWMAARRFARFLAGSEDGFHWDDFICGRAYRVV